MLAKRGDWRSKVVTRHRSSRHREALREPQDRVQTTWDKPVNPGKSGLGADATTGSFRGHPHGVEHLVAPSGGSESSETMRHGSPSAFLPRTDRLMIAVNGPVRQP
jgi:hypothetical protein